MLNRKLKMKEGEEVRYQQLLAVTLAYHTRLNATSKKALFNYASKTPKKTQNQSNVNYIFKNLNIDTPTNMYVYRTNDKVHVKIYPHKI